MGGSTPLGRKDDPGQVDDTHEGAWRRVSPREEERHVPMANKGKEMGPGRKGCRKQCPNEAVMQQDGRVTSQGQTR